MQVVFTYFHFASSPELTDAMVKSNAVRPIFYILTCETHILYSDSCACVLIFLSLPFSGQVCIAYETVEKADRSLPLLVPMSEIAGRMATQEGAKYLEKPMGAYCLLRCVRA
jgi:alanine dehydrogenase